MNIQNIINKNKFEKDNKSRVIMGKWFAVREEAVWGPVGELRFANHQGFPCFPQEDLVVVTRRNALPNQIHFQFYHPGQFSFPGFGPKECKMQSGF